MKRELLRWLVDPVERKPFSLAADTTSVDDITTGTLMATDGQNYRITRGIPRCVLTRDEGQAQTSEAFGFKWQRRDTYDSPAARGVAARWCVEKYGFESVEAWAHFYGSREVVV